jgi:mRNA interferase HicA|tara:strand:- start:1761 stop:1919 length:159 start_codon:yes stop_codon:yes gene_type:complete
VAISINQNRGKGSHATLNFGNRRTTIKDLKKEIGEGLLRSMLKDLGLDRTEL